MEGASLECTLVLAPLQERVPLLSLSDTISYVAGPALLQEVGLPSKSPTAMDCGLNARLEYCFSVVRQRSPPALADAREVLAKLPSGIRTCAIDAMQQQAEEVLYISGPCEERGDTLETMDVWKQTLQTVCVQCFGDKAGPSNLLEECLYDVIQASAVANEEATRFFSPCVSETLQPFSPRHSQCAPISSHLA